VQKGLERARLSKEIQPFNRLLAFDFHPLILFSHRFL
jgi:hypothetical protein